MPHVWQITVEAKPELKAFSDTHEPKCSDGTDWADWAVHNIYTHQQSSVKLPADHVLLETSTVSKSASLDQKTLSPMHNFITLRPNKGGKQARVLDLYKLSNQQVCTNVTLNSVTFLLM